MHRNWNREKESGNDVNTVLIYSKKKKIKF